MLNTVVSFSITSGNPRFASMKRPRSGGARKTRHFRAQSENASSSDIKSSRLLLNLNYEKDEKEKPLETTSDSFNEINYQKLKSRSSFRFLCNEDEQEGIHRESSVNIVEGMERESFVSRRASGSEKIIKFSDFAGFSMSRG